MVAKHAKHTERLPEAFQLQIERSLEICDLLEALADELPRRSAAVWRAAKRQCASVLHAHIALAADRIIPTLLARDQPCTDGRNVLLRFQSKYRTLAYDFDDLDDLLAFAVATDTHCIGPEALGYALRGHFEALRNHIGWEREVLLPMAMRAFAVAGHQIA